MFKYNIGNIFSVNAITSKQNAFQLTSSYNKLKDINNYKSYSTTSNDNFTKISEEVKNNACVLFMKGIPSAPQCGFSNAVVQVLEIQKAKYKSFNVLEDNNLRDAIKKIFKLAYYTTIIYWWQICWWM